MENLLLQLHEAGFQVRVPEEATQRSAIILVDVSEPTSTYEMLKTHQVLVDIRGSSLRISPHFYNTLEDITRLVTVLGDHESQETRVIVEKHKHQTEASREEETRKRETE